MRKRHNHSAFIRPTQLQLPYHGTVRCYWRGCRLVRCRAANADYQRRLYFERARGIRPKPSVKSGRARIQIKWMGRSQEGIARLTGVGQATISRILAGKNIRPSTEAKILRAA